MMSKKERWGRDGRSRSRVGSNDNPPPFSVQRFPYIGGLHRYARCIDTPTSLDLSRIPRPSQTRLKLRVLLGLPVLTDLPFLKGPSPVVHVSLSHSWNPSSPPRRSERLETRRDLPTPTKRLGYFVKILTTVSTLLQELPVSSKLSVWETSWFPLFLTESVIEDVVSNAWRWKNVVYQKSCYDPWVTCEFTN